jgi:hypothetical protein
MILPATSASNTPGSAAGIALILRIGVAMCFIGHGAFGIITKAAWVPYFAIVGIGEAAAWPLMPWVGAMDIAIGFLVFAWPCRALFLWAATWTVWTALLRPLAGEGWPEFFERAGNYGVPIAILALIGFGRPWLSRLPAIADSPDESARARLEWTLRITTATLLAGHATCALLLQKPALAQHYAVFNPADTISVMLAVGWCELALAAAVLLRLSPVLLIGVCAWKLSTEALFLSSGTAAPFFELVERGGSYAAPLALAWLSTAARTSFRSPVARTA